MAHEQPMLRQMTVADLIDATIRLYRRNFATILGICAVVRVPMMAVTIALQYALLRATIQPADASELFAQFGPIALGFLAVQGVIWIILYPLGEAALALAISRLYLGKQISISDAYEEAIKYWGRILWTAFLYYVFAFGVFLGGLCVVGVFLMVGVMLRYLFAPAIIVVIEDRSGVDGMGRSWSLTAGYFWHVFAVMAVLYLLVAVVAYSIMGPVQVGQIFYMENPEMLSAIQLISQVVAGIVGLLIYPVWMIGAVLVYYDLRIRKEGFDLMMMADSLGEPRPDVSAPGPADTAPSPEDESMHTTPPDQSL